MAKRALPKELRSLIHHTQLNHAGWWHRGVSRFVLATLWLRGAQSVIELKASIHAEFDVDISTTDLSIAIRDLTRDEQVIELADGRIKDSENARQTFLAEAEAVET